VPLRVPCSQTAELSGATLPTSLKSRTEAQQLTAEYGRCRIP
jgi:hypothetical protein